MTRHRKMTGRRGDEFKTALRNLRRFAEDSERNEARLPANLGRGDDAPDCESVFFLDGPDDRHECIRPEGHLDEGYVHMSVHGVKWGHEQWR